MLQAGDELNLGGTTSALVPLRTALFYFHNGLDQGHERMRTPPRERGQG